MSAELKYTVFFNREGFIAKLQGSQKLKETKLLFCVKKKVCMT